MFELTTWLASQKTSTDKSLFDRTKYVKKRVTTSAIDWLIPTTLSQSFCTP